MFKPLLFSVGSTRQLNILVMHINTKVWNISVLCYNRQVEDPSSFRILASKKSYSTWKIVGPK